jgi:adenosylmethionine-8-amino-7-oxononanoate aminotransferase
LLVAPPFVVTDEEIDEIVRGLHQAILDKWEEAR